MALNYGTNATFNGRITAPDASYPQGSSKDETSPGANDGMPYIKQRADDLLGMQQALLLEAAITPSGSADTALVSDYLDAMKKVLKSGRKNRLINPAFRIAQRALPIATPLSATYTLDRWRVSSDGADVSVSQVAKSASSVEKVLRITVVDATGLTFLNLNQVSASANTEDMQGVTVFLNAELRQSIGSGATITPTIFSGTVEDETNANTGRVTLTGDTDPLTAAYAKYGFGDALPSDMKQVAVNLDFGSVSTGDVFDISYIQLEPGTVPTDFESRPKEEEFALCEFYFEKSYDTDTDPGTVTGSGKMIVRPFIPAGTTSISSLNLRWAPKRAAPTVTLYSPATGATGVVRLETSDGTLPVSDIGANASSIGTKGCTVAFNPGRTTAEIGGSATSVQWAVDAEL